MYAKMKLYEQFAASPREKEKKERGTTQHDLDEVESTESTCTGFRSIVTLGLFNVSVL
jgi:hypothetical protein